MLTRRVTRRALAATRRPQGVAIALLLLSPTLARAESPGRADPFGPQLTWSPVLEIRGRLEGEGDPVPTTRTVGQVARVGIQAARGILSARVSLQEVRAWTGDRDGLSLSGSFTPDLAEGWVRLDGELSPNVGGRLTLGRQPIQIDDGRLVGRRGWSLEGQFLDALRFELLAAPLSFEVVNARRFERDPADEQGDPFSLGVTVLRLGVGREGVNVDGKLDLLSVVDARNTSGVTSTTGFFGTLAMGRGLGQAEGYVQQNATGVGSLLSGRVGWVLGARRAWVVGGGYTAASGDSTALGGQAAFQPVLGDQHDTYGLLDVLQPGDDPRGLSDLVVSADVQASVRVAVKLSGHRLAAPLDATTYGYEADAQLGWHITPYALVSLGAGVIGGGELGVEAGGFTQIGVEF